MLPYLSLSTFSLGPLPIQSWGTMVALGIAVGLWVAGKRARKLGLDEKLVYDLGVWTVIAAFVGARIGHSFFYDWGTTMNDPVEFLRIWHGGFSIMGGFIAALITAFWYLRHSQGDVWRYADATIFGLPIGLGIGRIGCFLIHDHPGTASDFFLAVQYPDGISRLDHGLLLSINGFLMAIVFWLMSRHKLPVGAYLTVFALWYGAVRLWLDFYRVADARFWGLTPAQYVAIVLMVAGGWGVYKIFLLPNRAHGKMRSI